MYNTLFLTLKQVLTVFTIMFTSLKSLYFTATVAVCADFNTNKILHTDLQI